MSTKNRFILIESNEFQRITIDSNLECHQRLYVNVYICVKWYVISPVFVDLNKIDLLLCGSCMLGKHSNDSKHHTNHASHDRNQQQIYIYLSILRILTKLNIFFLMCLSIPGNVGLSRSCTLCGQELYFRSLSKLLMY